MFSKMIRQFGDFWNNCNVCLFEEVFSMAIVYKCRHCGNVIGKLEEKVVDTSLLGFDQLSTKDKREMIHYTEDRKSVV